MSTNRTSVSPDQVEEIYRRAVSDFLSEHEIILLRTNIYSLSPATVCFICAEEWFYDELLTLKRPQVFAEKIARLRFIDEERGLTKNDVCYFLNAIGHFLDEDASR